MSERKYSVSEIDQLRKAIETKWLFGSYSQPRTACASRSFSGSERDAAVEQMVRTHMLAGHTADDLYASERPGQDA